jgi:predicted house-cleaning noncanonical NTP pyrophosphatase (MazG superfamily)
MGRRATAVKRMRRPLYPRAPVLIVEGDKLLTLAPDACTPIRVGHKAFGLASIPSAWTKPFFVVSGAQTPSSRTLSAALLRSGIPKSARLLVRSSGVTEIIDSRGKLASGECGQDQLLVQIGQLQAALPQGASVHWVVQELIRSIEKGQLSNERRVAQDKRDWLAEIEAAPLHAGEIHRIPLRTWRDKRPPTEAPLACVYRESIIDKLVVVARWTYERLIRVHFEWVWDGANLYVVQADPCDEVARGKNPHSLVKASIGTISPPLGLEVFRPASERDFQTYRKLANANLYRKLGYASVPFYVLDNAHELKNIVIEGRCSDAVVRDLRKLTAQPLVIRTDSSDSNRILREMLPRSDELRNAEAAIQWLVKRFRSKVNASSATGARLADVDLCLIAHHYVPAAASAWCQALPNQRRVRIESLWGIPEGLYWYAYDVFDVDTGTASEPQIDKRPLSLPFREKRRYKEHFIAPDEAGAWVVHRTSANADWARSITRSEWIEEIAWTSRCIAAKENKPAVVMWLIDTASNSTPHRVLPWYHQEWKQEGPIHKAAPRKKFATSAEVTIHSLADWAIVQADIDNGKRVARICIDPREPEMVRDASFVNALSVLAKKHDIVVELNGGILSHAYYMLSSAGCDVECADLDDFAVDDDAIEYNKLVRDGIPAAIAARGESVERMEVRGEALITSLRRKIIEEAYEVFDAKTANQIAEEIADLREVTASLMGELGIAEEDVAQVQQSKLKKRGGFGKGTMLGRTAILSSLRSQLSETSSLALGAVQPPKRTITESIDLPSTEIEGLHVDLRHSAAGISERQLTVVLPVHADGFAPPRTAFSLQTQDGHQHEMIFEVKFERSGADLRVRMSLVNAPRQLNLDLKTNQKY